MEICRGIGRFRMRRSSVGWGVGRGRGVKRISC